MLHLSLKFIMIFKVKRFLILPEQIHRLGWTYKEFHRLNLTIICALYSPTIHVWNSKYWVFPWLEGPPWTTSVHLIERSQAMGMNWSSSCIPAILQTTGGLVKYWKGVLCWNENEWEDFRYEHNRRCDDHYLSPTIGCQWFCHNNFSVVGNCPRIARWHHAKLSWFCVWHAVVA